MKLGYGTIAGPALLMLLFMPEGKFKPWHLAASGATSFAVGFEIARIDDEG